jgi:hypothetical protein
MKADMATGTESFAREGYLVVRNVFQPDEVAALASEAQTLIERTELIDVQNIRCRRQDHCETNTSEST